MQTSISKAALSSGLLSFLIILIFLFSKAGSFILLVIYIAPGLVYGLALIASANNPVSAFGSVIFVLLSMTINIICVYYGIKDFWDHGHYAALYAALNLVTGSTVGAVLLTICYDLIFLRRFSFFRTIAMPSIMGIAASLFSSLFMYLLISGKYNEFVSTTLWVGMLAIFPLWQYLIGLNLNSHSRSVYQVKL